MLIAMIFVVFPFCMLFAAVSDMLSMTIANRVPLILVGAFVMIAPLAGMDPVAIAWHLAAGATVLTVTFGLFALGGMGGGDAKLLAATSLWLGFDMILLDYLLTVAVLGGVLTLTILAYRKSPLIFFTADNLFLRQFAKAEGVPYAIALGLGGLIIFPRSPLMAWAMERLTAL